MRAIVVHRNSHVFDALIASNFVAFLRLFKVIRQVGCYIHDVADSASAKTTIVKICINNKNQLLENFLVLCRLIIAQIKVGQNVHREQLGRALCATRLELRLIPW